MNFSIENYQSDLYNLNISFNELQKKYPSPKYLYKYQSFYKSDRETYTHWKENFTGSFHCSLPKTFEDTNDCAPIVDKENVLKIIKEFLLSLQVDKETQIEVIRQANNDFSNEMSKRIIHNYQESIHVGCLTESYENTEMWNKYGDNSRGYCIEYDVSKCQGFKDNVFKVAYADSMYDISETFALLLILECLRKVENMSYEKMLEKYSLWYAKLLKSTYIPVFIKNKEKWSFENEWRVMILNNRTNSSGEKMKKEDYIDEKGNIDATGSISKIFLGHNFKNNKSCQLLELEIQKIINERNIKLIEMEMK